MTIWSTLTGTDKSRAIKIGECRDAKWHFDEVTVALPSASEIAVQASCIKRVAYEFQAVAVAIPNGTHIASYAGRSKAAREGLATGFPDLMIIGYSQNERRVAFAEIKAKSQPSCMQWACLTWLHAQGYGCGIFRSQDTLADWLKRNGWK